MFSTMPTISIGGWDGSNRMDFPRGFSPEKYFCANILFTIVTRGFEASSVSANHRPANKRARTVGQWDDQPSRLFAALFSCRLGLPIISKVDLPPARFASGI